GVECFSIRRSTVVVCRAKVPAPPTPSGTVEGPSATACPNRLPNEGTACNDADGTHVLRLVLRWRKHERRVHLGHVVLDVCRLHRVSGGARGATPERKGPMGAGATASARSPNPQKTRPNLEPFGTLTLYDAAF